MNKQQHDKGRPAATHSVYLTDALWDRLGRIAERTTGGSYSQLIESLLQSQLPHIEASMSRGKGLIILTKRT